MQNPVVTIRTQTRPANELINLATPLFQQMMRIKAGMATPSEETRQTIQALLKTFEEKGSQRGYKERQLQDAKFALVAFIDETLLVGEGALREEWELYPLQLEYFKEALAGNKFFERLDYLLKDGNSEIDVVEIYYLCLLLGFKGKYQVFLEGQLPAVTRNVAEHLRQAGRLQVRVLSPNALLNDQPKPPSPEPELPRWVKITALAAVGVVALAYLILNWSLLSMLEAAMRESLLK